MRLSAKSISAPAVGLLVLSGVIFSLLYLQFFFNWPRNEDLELLDTVRGWNDHSMSMLDLLETRNGDHPIGMQSAAHLAIFEFLGVNFRNVIVFNHTVLIASGLALFAAVRGALSTIAACIIAVLISAVFFHPIQTNNLLWPFQTGWFLIDLAFVLNILLIERLGWKGLPALVVTGAVATLSSRHGVFVWFVAAFHLTLLGGRGNRLAALVMFAGFAAGLLLAPSTDAHLPGVADVGGLIVYSIALVGGTFGDRDPAWALGLGAIVLACAVVAVGKIALDAKTSRALDPVDRATLVLILASGLCVAAFALGRYANGLGWVFDRFHAATTMIPLLLGLCLWWGRLAAVSSGLRRVVSALPVLLILASAGTALPFARERSRDDYRQRALAMLATCGAEPRSDVLLAGIHGFSVDEQIVARNMAALKRLCGEHSPSKKMELYAQYPDRFLALEKRNPAWASALHALWDVYYVRLDLQDAFPIDSADLPDHLVQFAAGDAREGSHYEPASLGPHGKTYLALADAL